jgi:hypothetical protein
MKHPFKLPREKRLDCKLTDNDIESIRNLRKSGMTFKAISKIYNVTDQAIYYWCCSDEQKKRRQDRHSEYLKTHKIKRDLSYQKNWEIRKRNYLIEMVTDRDNEIEKLKQKIRELEKIIK